METPSPTDTISEFRRRTLRMHRSFFTVLAAFAIAIISMAVLPSPYPHLLALVAMVLLVPFALASKRYRCPACNAKPIDPEGDEVMFPPPKECRACGGQLG